jgi:predicted enzyme related to lactoylglutathione lyase
VSLLNLEIRIKYVRISQEVISMKVKGYVWAGLFVEDLDKAVAFYEDVLGLKLLRRGDGWAHFDVGEDSLFEIYTGGKAWSQPKEHQEQPLVIGFLVEDLDAAVKELRGKGVKFIGEIGRYKDTKWAEFSDPEGNRLEIKEIPGIR